MSSIKKFRDQVLESYNSNKTFYRIKFFIGLLILPLIVFSLNDIVVGILSESSEEFPLNAVYALCLLIVIRIILNGIIESIFLTSGRIVDNMKELPREVGGKKTIVQYDLSKEVTPSEAAMILYGRSELSSLISIIYWWVYKGIVKITIKDGKKYLESNHKPGKNYTVYDNYLYNELFAKTNIVRVNKGVLSKYKVEVNNLIVLSCLKKGYIVSGNDVTLTSILVKIIKSIMLAILSMVYLVIILMTYVAGDIEALAVTLIFLVLIVAAKIVKNYEENMDVEQDSFESTYKKIKKGKTNTSISILLIVLGFICFLVFSFNNYLIGFFILMLILFIIISKYQNKKYNIRLTDRGKNILSEIYGYKYYLERCEEEQINVNLGYDEVYSKNLSYAIALKLNWKIIDELC